MKTKHIDTGGRSNIRGHYGTALSSDLTRDVERALRVPVVRAEDDQLGRLPSVDYAKLMARIGTEARNSQSAFEDDDLEGATSGITEIEELADQALTMIDGANTNKRSPRGVERDGAAGKEEDQVLTMAFNAAEEAKAKLDELLDILKTVNSMSDFLDASDMISEYEKIRENLAGMNEVLSDDIDSYREPFENEAPSSFRQQD